MSDEVGKPEKNKENPAKFAGYREREGATGRKNEAKGMKRESERRRTAQEVERRRFQDGSHPVVFLYELSDGAERDRERGTDREGNVAWCLYDFASEL